MKTNCRESKLDVCVYKFIVSICAATDSYQKMLSPSDVYVAGP